MEFMENSFILYVLIDFRDGVIKTYLWVFMLLR